MKAIFVKYLAPTNTKSARLKAFDSDGNSTTIAFPYEDNEQQAYNLAAKTLCQKMDWHGKLQGGYTKEGMVFTFIEKTNQVRLA